MIEKWQQILKKKSQGLKISMLTAYDYPTAVLLDQAGIDLLLVGDSLANVVLGLDSTTQVGMAEMLHHTKAVIRGSKETPVVGDMPFDAYQPAGSPAVMNAKQLMGAGCVAVKVEWFERCLEVTEALVRAGVPVIGHVGLTPQTAELLGGFKMQGKDEKSAARIMTQSLLLEQTGCSALVLECVPDELAQAVTQALKIPTIGIGAGPFCDGQVLVTNDMLGLNSRKVPKFVKKYADIGAEIQKAAISYKREVEQGNFP
jgi:3-methyl-2-oxobutanoate hydroxymethyltransferase